MPRLVFWRRGGDLNPGWFLRPQPLSRRSPSAARTPLHICKWWWGQDSNLRCSAHRQRVYSPPLSPLGHPTFLAERRGIEPLLGLARPLRSKQAHCLSGISPCFLVPAIGLEPICVFQPGLLRPLRLPVPPCGHFGWGEKARTPISRSKVCCPAVGRLPNVYGAARKT